MLTPRARHVTIAAQAADCAAAGLRAPLSDAEKRFYRTVAGEKSGAAVRALVLLWKDPDFCHAGERGGTGAAANRRRLRRFFVATGQMGETGMLLLQDAMQQ